MLNIDEIKNTIICGDCLEVMKQLPDKCVDLVLTDPPYGIGADKAQNAAAKQRIKADGKSKAGRGWRLYPETNWDESIPTEEVFSQILRISRNQIIWGGNYFTKHLPASSGWMVWNKCQRDFSLADAELAWTSFDKAIRICDCSRGEALQDGRVHPTQKPLRLIRWCLDKRSKEGDTILDPFLGSGTTAVACYRTRRNYIGIEISPEYCKIAEKRIQEEKNKLALFNGLEAS
jgi:site-specific DNA-methyltransferase (adenine-specific)